MSLLNISHGYIVIRMFKACWYVKLNRSVLNWKNHLCHKMIDFWGLTINVSLPHARKTDSDSQAVEPKLKQVESTCNSTERNPTHFHIEGDTHFPPMVSAKTNTVIIVTGTRPDNCCINIYFAGENESKQSPSPWFQIAAWFSFMLRSGGGLKSPLMVIHFHSK